MTKQVVIVTGSKNFNVNLPDFQYEKKSLEKMKEDYLKGEMEFQPMWGEENSKKELVLSDLDAMMALLDEIEGNPDVLIPHIAEIRKKKNGDFWKNSGHDVFIAENCTTYFTDFTNAWSALVLRLDVNTNDTCTLDVRHRTYS